MAIVIMLLPPPRADAGSSRAPRAIACRRRASGLRWRSSSSGHPPAPLERFQRQADVVRDGIDAALPTRHAHRRDVQLARELLLRQPERLAAAPQLFGFHRREV